MNTATDSENTLSAAEDSLCNFATVPGEGNGARRAGEEGDERAGFTQSIARSAYQAVFTVRGSVAPRHVTALKYGIVRRPLIPCTCVEKRAAHASSI